MSSSLKKYQCQPNILLNIAKMRFDNDGMQTIVVEGETDYRLFRQWLIERNARIENVDGKSNVKEIWRKAKERRFISIHCIADLDFDLVLKDNPIIDDQFIYVSIKEGNSESDIECNDLESALIRSHSLTKVMSQKYRGLDLYQDFEVRIEELREQLNELNAQKESDEITEKEIENMIASLAETLLIINEDSPKKQTRKAQLKNPRPEVGSVWNKPKGKRKITLSVGRRDLVDSKTSKPLDYISEESRMEIAEDWLRVRPTGGRVFVDEEGDAATLLGEDLVYLGNISDFIA